MSQKQNVKCCVAVPVILPSVLFLGNCRILSVGRKDMIAAAFSEGKFMCIIQFLARNICFHRTYDHLENFAKFQKGTTFYSMFGTAQGGFGRRLFCILSLR